MKGFIPLSEVARRLRVRWRVAYRLITSGKVRAHAEGRGGKLRWYVAERDVAALKKNPPWEQSGYNGPHAPTRSTGPANERIDRRASTRRRSAKAIARLK